MRPSYLTPTLLWVLPYAPTVLTQSLSYGPSVYTVPGAFPTSVFQQYYNIPTQTTVQVQPKISDPVTHKTYPLSLTDPLHIPVNDTKDPHPLPDKYPDHQRFESAYDQILAIAENPIFGDKCSKCIASLAVAKGLVQSSPESGPLLAVRLCDHFQFSKTCGNIYSRLALGSVITQVVANANVGRLDGQMLCQNFLSLCPLPPATPLNLTNWFSKPKPSPLPVKKPSGKRLKILHISDLHLDPRYSTGSEANCTQGLCCRANNYNSASPNVTVSPAPRFGAFICDSPLALVTSAMQAIPALTGTDPVKAPFHSVIYTGDMVAHDPQNQLSRDFVMYTETLVFGLFKKFFGSPVYISLGNHDSYNDGQDAPHSLGKPLSQQFQWNYDHVASLWQQHGWLSASTSAQARSHYAGYSVERAEGFRVISLNTDLWYRANYFNYINMTDPDVSGMLRFLTDELQHAEDAKEKVWIIGHVLSGWDGSNALINPSNLFYQIVDRFSPHVISGIFFGHTHEDQFSIFYANNATSANAQTAQTVSWMAPSLTPINNLNSGFRVYEVDSATFEIMDAHTWSSDVSKYLELDHQTQFGPTYSYEYSTRVVYGASVEGWGPNDPLNATWWHKVTEAMQKDPSLVSTFTKLQGKSSVRTKPCEGDCAAAKVCYMRSGSSAIGKGCLQGFGSVQ